MKLETCLKYLQEVGAGNKSHGKGTLLDHLQKTYNTLVEEEQDEDVCFAGLFHSVYGTQYFTHETTNDRAAVKELIGKRAERLAWLFCNLDRGKFINYYGQEKYPSLSGEMIDVSHQDAEDLFSMYEANRITQNV